MCTWIMSNVCLLLQQYSLIYVIFGSQVDTSIVTWILCPVEHGITSKVKLVLKSICIPAKSHLSTTLRSPAQIRCACEHYLFYRGIYVFIDQASRLKNSIRSTQPHFVRIINP